MTSRGLLGPPRAYRDLHGPPKTSKDLQELSKTFNNYQHLPGSTMASGAAIVIQISPSAIRKPMKVVESLWMIVDLSPWMLLAGYDGYRKSMMVVESPWRQLKVSDS